MDQLVQRIQRRIELALERFLQPTTSIVNNDLELPLPARNTVGLPPNNRLANQNLPALPAAVLERIRRGKFVNLDLLLPNNVPSETFNLFSMSLDQSTDVPRVLVNNLTTTSRNRIVAGCMEHIFRSIFNFSQSPC